MSPAVSIIIPAYNRAGTLPRALDSVIAQSFDDWEIVLIDDGSNDATAGVIEAYQTRLRDRFVSIRQCNRGCSAARNRGIELCRGRFVAFLDSDDEILPQKLARQLELFTACPELAFVYSDYAFVDLEGRRSESAIAEKFPLARTLTVRRVGEGLYATGAELFAILLRGYFIATIVGLVRREALGAIRFDERLSYSEEWLFYLQLARAGRAGFVDEPLALHHFTPNSLTRTDKSRNIARQCELFSVMKKVLHGLTPDEQKILDAHLAQAHAQLAIEFRNAGRPLKSLVAAAKARFYGRRLHEPRTLLSPAGGWPANDGDQVGCLPVR